MILTMPGWRKPVTVTEAQYAAGVEAFRRRPDSHHAVWVVLREAGVPVRGGPGEFPASQAATCIRSGVVPLP